MFHPALFTVLLWPGVGLIVEELRAKRGAFPVSACSWSPSAFSASAWASLNSCQSQEARMGAGFTFCIGLALAIGGVAGMAESKRLDWFGVFLSLAGGGIMVVSFISLLQLSGVVH